MRRGALRSALSAQIDSGNVSVIDSIGVTEPRTKALVARLRSLGVEAGPTLLVVSEISPSLARAARNVEWLELETPRHASVYQLIRNDRVIFEKAALLDLEEALSK
jgi:large subunit ribosomal protein L4